MARYYRRYKKQRSSPLVELLVGLCFLAVLSIWADVQRGDTAMLVYAGVTTVVIVALIVSLVVWKYQQDQRKIRTLDIAGIDTMDPLEFEKYVAKLLQNQGFSDVRLTEKYDYGVDIIARKDGVTWGIQVKRWSNIVKAEAVRAVVTALIRYKCDRAMVVTNNTFSRPAIGLASDNNCVLIGREELTDWIVQFQDVSHNI